MKDETVQSPLSPGATTTSRVPRALVSDGGDQVNVTGAWLQRAACLCGRTKLDPSGSKFHGWREKKRHTQVERNRKRRRTKRQKEDYGLDKKKRAGESLEK